MEHISRFRELDRKEHQLNAIGRGERQGFAGETADMTTARRNALGEVVEKQ